MKRRLLFLRWAMVLVTCPVAAAEKPPPQSPASKPPPLAVAPFDADQAKRHQQAWAKYLGVPVMKTNSIGMKLVLIPAGQFRMGAGQLDRITDEHPQHEVRITKLYYLGAHEVTQGEWERVMGSKPWSGETYVKEGPDYATSYVSWENAQEFCKRLSGKEGTTYRLPTEAEWEYACRAGTKTKYGFGDDESLLGEYAWYGDNAGNKAGEEYVHRVGQKKPNPWGLYDMHGNVLEWCADWYDTYSQDRTEDPTGPSMGLGRVLRGGSWGLTAWHCRSAHRTILGPSYRHGYLGFRVVAVPSSKQIDSAAQE